MQKSNRPPNSSQSTKSWLPAVTDFRLPNGVGGLFIDMPNCPAFSFRAIFRAGDYLCPEDKPDLAHFLEHLVLGANKNYSSQAEFWRAIIANGGKCNAFTGSVYIKYEFDTPDFDWDRMLDLAISAISQPLFLPSEFASEKDVVRNEHRLYLDDPRLKITSTVERQMGLPSPHPDDRLAGLDSTVIEDIHSYYRRTHTLGNARFIFAGQLPLDRQQLIKQKLATLELPDGDQPNLPNKPLRGDGLFYEPKADAATVAYDLSLTTGDLPLDPSTSATWQIIYYLLFHGDHSWIFGAARQRGLVYGIQGYIHDFGPSTIYSFAGQVKADNLKPLLDLILAAIDRLLVGDLSDSDFDYQKNAFVGANQMHYMLPDSWISQFYGHYVDCDLIVPVDWGTVVESVTKSQLIDTANKMFGQFDWTWGLLGDVPLSIRQEIEIRLNSRQPTT